MMCYPSIDSLVKKVDSKYTLVTLAALRARELTDGQTPLIALEEIYEGKITYSFSK